jgi:CHAD domain-containing protein
MAGKSPHRLIRYYDALFKQISLYYWTAVNTADEENIHNLRVAIKRLRVFLEFLQFVSPRFAFRPHFRPFRIIFRTAGPLRDVHVQQSLVLNWIQKSHRSFDSYYNLLKAEEIKKRRTYFRNIRTTTLAGTDQTRTKSLRLAGSMSDMALQYKMNQRFVNIIQDIVFQQNTPNFTESEFHHIRIRSKEARYTLELVQLYDSSEKYAAINHELQDIHHALGMWHDFEIAQTFLQKTGLDDPVTPYFQAYLLRRKKECLGRFKRLWPDFLENHAFKVQNSVLR